MCGGLSLRPYDYDYRGATISKCRACKVRFLNPQPSDQTLHSLYASYDGLKAPLQEGGRAEDVLAEKEEVPTEACDVIGSTLS